MSSLACNTGPCGRSLLIGVTAIALACRSHRSGTLENYLFPGWRRRLSANSRNAGIPDCCTRLPAIWVPSRAFQSARLRSESSYQYFFGGSSFLDWACIPTHSTVPNFQLRMAIVLAGLFYVFETLFLTSPCYQNTKRRERGRETEQRRGRARIRGSSSCSNG